MVCNECCGVLFLSLSVSFLLVFFSHFLKIPESSKISCWSLKSCLLVVSEITCVCVFFSQKRQHFYCRFVHSLLSQKEQSVCWVLLCLCGVLCLQVCRILVCQSVSQSTEEEVHKGSRHCRQFNNLSTYLYF